MSLLDTIHKYFDSGTRWDDSDDVPLNARAELIESWKDDANPSEISEAYIGGSDNDDDLKTLIAFALDEVLTHQAQEAMLNCFWAGMSWRVDEAIEKVREELRSERPTREQVQAEWRLEEMRTMA